MINQIQNDRNLYTLRKSLDTKTVMDSAHNLYKTWVFWSLQGLKKSVYYSELNNCQETQDLRIREM